jgi:hypothetical protein
MRTPAPALRPPARGLAVCARERAPDATDPVESRQIHAERIPRRRGAVHAAEVAALRGIEIDQARAGLEGTGASFTPSANDGYSSA